MAFNFGGTGGGGFSFNSTAQPAGSTSTPLFGAPPASTASPAGGLFGQTNPQASTFGFGPPVTSAAPASTPSLFGGAAAPSSFSVPSFGTPASAPKPLFGGGNNFSLGNTTTPPGTPGPGPLSFGVAPTSTAPPATGLFGGFGASTTPVAAPPAAAGGLFSGGGMFGGGGGGLGGGKREAESDGGARKAPGLFGTAPSNSSPLSFGAVPPPTTSAPTSLFGAPASTPTAQPPAPAASFNLFSQPPPAVASSTPAAAPSLFGAAAPSAPKPLFGLPTPAAPTSSVPSFGVAPTATAPPNLKPTLSTAPTTSSPLSFAPPISNPLTVSSLSFAKPPTASPLGLGGALSKPGGITVPATGAAAATTASTATAPVPSILRGKTLEEIVNSWSGELEERTRDFMDIAGEVREWDRILRENGEQISALYTSILPLSPLHNQISSSLDYVESQQKDLSAILDSYEAQIGDLVEQSPSNTAYRNNSGQAEKEREKAYTLASTLSNSLDTTSTSLSSLIQTLNSLSPSLSPSSQQAQQAEDPLNQIAAILNAHLGSLKWIEGTTANLRKGVRELEVRVGEVGGRSGAVSNASNSRNVNNLTPSRGMNGSYRR